MKTKKRAIRRVTCVPSLDHVDVAQFPQEKDCSTLDLGLDTIVPGIGSVGVCLDRLSKRLCERSPVASHVSSAIDHEQSQTPEARKEPDAFIVDRQCNHTDPVFFKQPFQSMVRVANRVPVESCSSDFGCSNNTNQPVQTAGTYHVCCA